MRIRSLTHFNDRAQAVDFALGHISHNMPREQRIKAAAAYGNFACPIFSVENADCPDEQSGLATDSEATAPIYAISIDDNFIAVAVCSVRTEHFPLRLSMLAVHPHFSGRGLALELASHVFASAPVVMGAVEKPAFKRLYRKAGVTCWMRVGGRDDYWIGSTQPFPQPLRYGVPVVDDVEQTLLRHGMTRMVGDLLEVTQ
ncbi:GNAT family N-acetyltransferase [Rhizobium puerariae]|uniref:GNAT family N-acetyltransferase n=1 Tax=Rhizobium puerariae TaxID=1585791 RepID=A0ABV6AHD5_9HYPH